MWRPWAATVEFIVRGCHTRTESGTFLNRPASARAGPLVCRRFMSSRHVTSMPVNAPSDSRSLLGELKLSEETGRVGQARSLGVRSKVVDCPIHTFPLARNSQTAHPCLLSSFCCGSWIRDKPISRRFSRPGSCQTAFLLESTP